MVFFGFINKRRKRARPQIIELKFVALGITFLTGSALAMSFFLFLKIKANVNTCMVDLFCKMHLKNPFVKENAQKSSTKTLN